MLKHFVTVSIVGCLAVFVALAGVVTFEPGFVRLAVYSGILAGVFLAGWERKY